MNQKAGQSKARHSFWRVFGIVLLVVAVVFAIGLHRLHRKLPPDLMANIRAGMAARKISDPDQRLEKYLEGRYGPQTDPKNREKVFLDFFNAEHVKTLQWLVRHTPEKMRQANIDATARWIEHYRQSLTPAERADLGAQLLTPEGHARLQAATAQYNAQDVFYRGETAPVISQLLTTIASLPKP